MKKLSIIIPYHNEDESLITPLYRSLEEQVLVDWNEVEIIVSNNCEEPKKLTKFFKQFPKIYPHIKYIECAEKSGMGQNRQNGLNCATGKYVMFCDSDDSLLTLTSIGSVLYALNEDREWYSSSVMRIEKTSLYQNKSAVVDMTAGTYLLHGKVFKLDEIKKIGISFNNNLFAYEDFYFLFLVSSAGYPFVRLPEDIYAWKNRTSSVSGMNGAGNNYSNKYVVDSFIYLYYGVQALEASNELSPELMRSAVSVALTNINRERYRLSNSDSIADEVAALIYNDFGRYVKEGIEVANQFDDASISYFMSWVESIKSLDVETFRHKYKIPKATKYIYPESVEVKYIE